MAACLMLSGRGEIGLTRAERHDIDALRFELGRFGGHGHGGGLADARNSIRQLHCCLGLSSLLLQALLDNVGHKIMDVAAESPDLLDKPRADVAVGFRGQHEHRLKVR